MGGLIRWVMLACAVAATAAIAGLSTKIAINHVDQGPISALCPAPIRVLLVVCPPPHQITTMKISCKRHVSIDQCASM